MTLRIEDYAIVGDTHTVALVGNNGSIDWLCLPRFDSHACFASLLGDAGNGHWRIAPAQEITAVRRRYVGRSMVLCTELECAEGVVEITDFMPRADDFHRADLVRIVRGKRGKVRMRMELVVRFDYGRTVPWVRIDGNDLRALAGPDGLHLAAPVALEGDNHRIGCAFDIAAEQAMPFTLTWFPSHESMPEPHDPHEMLETTRSWWEEWAATCAVQGPWREQVTRSLLTLKALTYSPTGGIVAAATTSLPEWIGGCRNWDYRFCWLRDAGLTLSALLRSGFRKEAAAWRDWLLRAVAGDPEQIQIMYGIAGERDIGERELPWLSGYAGSTPVRVGNGAFDQLQLDIYGQVLDVFHQLHNGSDIPEADAWRMLCALLEDLENKWRQPDEGLWEVRAENRHFVHSKVMCWVAFDRALKFAAETGCDAPVERWKAVRDSIHAEVCRAGFSPEKNSFVQFYGADEVDAALLMIPLVDFLPADDPRVQGTMEAIRADLMDGDLIHRYRWSPGLDGLPHGEGAFLVCSFWYVDALCKQKRFDEAEAMYERLLGLANDVGLYAEEYDPDARRHLGNFPQAFSHIGLISAAIALQERG